MLPNRKSGGTGGHDTLTILRCLCWGERKMVRVEPTPKEVSGALGAIFVQTLLVTTADILWRLPTVVNSVTKVVTIVWRYI